MEAKGLDTDQVHEEKKQRILSRKSNGQHGNGEDAMVGTSVEVEAEDTNAVVAMEMMGDGIAMIM